MMRGKILMAGVFGLLSVGLVVGQPGGFQPGGFQQSGDPYTLLRNKQVQKELDITTEQMEKLPAAVQKALKEVLNDKQLTRLNQIILQQKGINAFKDAEVQQKLNMSAAQKSDINALFSKFDEESEKIRKEEGFKGFKKIGEMRKELTEQVNSVLSEAQRETLNELKGEPVKLGGPGFGGPGGKGPGGKKPPQRDDT